MAFARLGPARSRYAYLPYWGVALLTLTLLAACATDTIEDRRYGQQLVCHDGKTLAVSNADSFVHLDHGDSPGPCPAD